MPVFSFQLARACVVRELRARAHRPAVEHVSLESAADRVLAQDISADRDYPPLDRSVRDGFAVRSADLPGRLRVIGEVRAGETFSASVGPGEAVEIMTGAPIPEGADAVVMIEHVTVQNDHTISTDRAAAVGQFINPQGGEARVREVLLDAGKRLTFTDIALLAAVGCESVAVFAKPAVAIIPTGDEIVPVGATPQAHQIRNSNAYSLAVQVARAGGTPEILPVARDEYEHTRALIERGLTHHLLLLSGGVSAGKHDIVEKVLADCSAQFFFDRVAIQPGQPLVFGLARNTFFFGLPGNPASTMVTFEIFARAAVEMLGGQTEPRIPFTLARLTQTFRHKPGLTRFLPALITGDRAAVMPIPWTGSSDVPALCRANAFLMADAEREEWKAGESIPVLLK